MAILCNFMSPNGRYMYGMNFDEAPLVGDLVRPDDREPPDSLFIITKRIFRASGKAVDLYVETVNG